MAKNGKNGQSGDKSLADPTRLQPFDKDGELLTVVIENTEG
jgi:hypothetical protein